MTITFVGAGNLASHLAPALARSGHEVICVYSRTMKSALELTERVGQKSYATDDLQQILPAEAYIISIKDDAIPEVVAAWPEHCRNGVIMHTSGTTGMDILNVAGEHIGVLYPMQTFSKNKSLDFNKIPCFIESNDKFSYSVVKKLADSISSNVSELDSTGRRMLHIGAVFACNFSNHLYALAYEILEKNCIDPKCLIPLIDETAAKLHHLHPHEGQTGPARRDDQLTISRHQEALEEQMELLNIYNTLTESIKIRF